MTSKAVIKNTESNHVLLVTIYNQDGSIDSHEHLEPEESVSITLWDSKFITISEQAFRVGIVNNGS